MDIPGIGKKIVKAKLLCVILDLPAKASMLNCNQFNGAYGCSTCKHPGVSVSSYIILFSMNYNCSQYSARCMVIRCCRET